MGVPFQEAVSKVDEAIGEIFDKDQRVQAVGIGRHGSLFGFHAVRNVRKILPSSASTQSLNHISEIPIHYVDAQHDIRNELLVPADGPGSPTASSFVLERARHRPLVCGLQIQNFDDDDRQGNIGNGFITIGTLGCFVELDSGATALLSNNHVIAGENDGQAGLDRIVQPGTIVAADVAADQVAVLTDFVTLLTSPLGARPFLGNVNFNDLDVGVATLGSKISFQQDYLSHHLIPAISGFASAVVGDRVFKVGRTTGLTFGEVTSVTTTVGPVPYRPGECWFQNSIEIVGQHGTQFSDQGDSGSAIVRTNGEIVGILYAGNGTQTYACPIDLALSEFNCTLI